MERQTYGLEELNESLKLLGFSMKYLKLPKVHEGYTSLEGKRIVMVDDSMPFIELLIPHLLMATEGRAWFIHQQTKDDIDSGEQAWNIAEQILNFNPDIVLLDYNLDGDIKASYISSSLMLQNFQPIFGDRYTKAVAGMSAERHNLKDFQIAPQYTQVTILKDMENPDQMVNILAERCKEVFETGKNVYESE